MNSYLQPDYTKSLGQVCLSTCCASPHAKHFKVYSNVTHHFLTQYESLDVLCGWQTLGREKSLPWWIPDYDLNQDLAASPLVPKDGRESIYAASGYDHRSKFQPSTSEPSNWSRLETTGLYIDSVAVLLDPGPEDESFDSMEIRWQSLLLSTSGLLKDLPSEVQSFLTNVSMVINKYSQIRHSADPSSLSVEPIDIEPHLYEIDIVEAYIQTLLSGRISTRQRLTKDIIKALMSFQLPTQMSDLTQQQWFENICNAFEAGIIRRKLAVTRKGYIGTLPQEAMPEDLICVLFGCSVPVVLRKALDSDSYMLVGECYLYGFMDAEAIVMQVKGIMKAQDFVLC